MAPSADPALNPNHPNQSIPVPKITNGMLAGFSIIFFLWPRKIAPIKAASVKGPHDYSKAFREDNIKFSKHKNVKGQEYQKYDNFDAIEIPYTDSIPSDYKGVMGVPISFLDKYNPDQFEILGCSYDYGRPEGWDENIKMSVSINGKHVYKRILIQHKKQG